METERINHEIYECQIKSYKQVSSHISDKRLEVAPKQSNCNILFWTQENRGERTKKKETKEIKDIS